MKALLFRGPEKIEYGTAPDPLMRDDGDAIVRVLRAGICGSDLHIYHGRETGLDDGTVMGHEFAGEVVEVGRAVRRFRPGELVCSPFTPCCGHCFYCGRGLTARCDNAAGFFGWVAGGQGLHGGQAEYVRVPLADATLVKVPEGIELDQALLLGDNFATGVFCADMADVRENGVYAVVGCGVVGLIAALAARERGAAAVIATDTIAHRRQLALAMGATEAVAPDLAVAAVRDATAGRGADAVMEAVGIPPAQKLAVQLLRPGGTLAVVGMHTADHFAFTPFDAYNLNLTYKTGRCPARHYMEPLIPALRKHREKLKLLISHHVPLSRGQEAYSTFANKDDNCTKVILHPDQ